MGQQQIILIVLVAIVIGIATIVAIDNMQSAHDSSIHDSIQQDIMQAQSHSIAYLKKSTMMGGGGGSYMGMTMKDILLPEQNDNASYELEDVTQDSFTIVATTVYGFSVTAIVTVDEIEWERNVID